MARLTPRRRLGVLAAALLIAVATVTATAGLAARRPVAASAGTLLPQRSAATIVVASLGAGAQATRLAAGADDLYVIDAAAAHVRRYILHGLSRAELFTQVMRWKEGAAGLIMGRPLDLSLAGGHLLILDDLASLWSYRAADYSRALVPLRVQSWQGRLDALALHGADLFVLDRDRRQMWRYAPSSGGYDTAPRAVMARPDGALATAGRLASSQSALLALSHGVVLVFPWRRSEASRALRLAQPVTGLWATESRQRFLVSFAHAVSICTPSGHVDQVLGLRDMRGEMIRDLALDPTGRLYVLTASRILRVAATIPPL